MYGLYGVLLRLAWAVVLPYQIVSARLAGRPGPPVRERFAVGPTPDGLVPGGFWVHAVSVGEVRLALSTIAALRRRWPGRPIHLTTCTPTGRGLALEARAAGRPGAPDSLSDAPIDLPGPVGRFLDRTRPRCLLLIETELWPNMLRLAGARGVTIAVLNGRISPRALPRYRRARALFTRALGHVALFAMQSEEDAVRIRSLGARPSAVHVPGNMKFDLPRPAAAAATVRRRLGFDEAGPILVAGSSARGEEAAIIEAFLALRRNEPGARLVVAPRHPEDVPAAEEALAAAGLVPRRYSATSAAEGVASGAARAVGGGGAADAVVVDVLGVLPEIYVAATLAFVGGSLVPRGGQNLLEPAAVGCPVLFGPLVDNWRAAADALLRAGGGFMVDDGRALAGQVTRLAADPAARRQAGERALAVVESNRGALERTLDLVAGQIDPAAGTAA
ncbi:MAG TPA: glycosyltransferase N-terminal domain-containing protein [Patescibacteria group bacterium]|nr:glycosyltransferase N-terminal domain-containing protein [Patescibacteria group bacterium]